MAQKKTSKKPNYEVVYGAHSIIELLKAKKSEQK